MPVASTSKRINRKAASVAQGPLRSKKNQVLRIINEPETIAWNEALKNATLVKTSFETLDEACEYPFKVCTVALQSFWVSRIAYCSIQ